MIPELEQDQDEPEIYYARKTGSAPINDRACYKDRGTNLKRTSLAKFELSNLNTEMIKDNYEL